MINKTFRVLTASVKPNAYVKADTVQLVTDIINPSTKKNIMIEFVIVKDTGKNWVKETFGIEL